jgi:hypothetical protein
VPCFVDVVSPEITHTTSEKEQYAETANLASEWKDKYVEREDKHSDV